MWCVRQSVSSLINRSRRPIPSVLRLLDLSSSLTWFTNRRRRLEEAPWNRKSGLSTKTKILGWPWMHSPNLYCSRIHPKYSKDFKSPFLGLGVLNKNSLGVAQPTTLLRVSEPKVPWGLLNQRHIGSYWHWINTLLGGSQSREWAVFSQSTPSIIKSIGGYPTKKGNNVLKTHFIAIDWTIYHL